MPPPSALAPIAVACLATAAFAGTGDRIADAETARRLFHHDVTEQLATLRQAAVTLPIAAIFGAVLAFRPRRRSTPPRSPAVIQTQIVLAVLGAVVMLVVGASLARAFGIVGATGLVRYRSKIDDAKDAGVMLSTLGIGLAAGVGQFMLAAYATVFILGLLWVVESLEPEACEVFNLRVAGKVPTTFRGSVERLLRRNGVGYALRSASDEELCYEVRVPLDRETDRLSDAILALSPGRTAAVHWDDKKSKR